MPKPLSVKVSRSVQAPASKVWQALVDPRLIQQYLFGTQAYSDWKKGSPITYTGSWQGKPYVDKGTIVEIVSEQLLHTTYLSGLSGKEDRPENYAHVIYRLKPLGDKATQISIEQNPITSTESAEHLRQNWTVVLDGLKEVVERL